MRSKRVDEPAFWDYLEYRVCHELLGMDHPDVRGPWCDGLIPERYLLADPSPRISGRVWIGIGPKIQEAWTFTLLLAPSFTSRESIDWWATLPPPNVTGWLTVDRAKKTLVLQPAAVVADRFGWRHQTYATPFHACNNARVILLQQKFLNRDQGLDLDTWFAGQFGRILSSIGTKRSHGTAKTGTVVHAMSRGWRVANGLG